MTHNDIYTKFMIEYDKANVTSSYPSLTKYEAATLLDRAYLALISRKLTGNNTRRAPFEYDTKAIEDLRPLLTTTEFRLNGKTYSEGNEYRFNIPNNLMYYIEGLATYPNDEQEIVIPVNHLIARKFRKSNSNIPWIKQPVSFMEGQTMYVLIDPFKHKSGFSFDGTYIKKPASFVESLEKIEDDNNSDNNNGCMIMRYEFSDTKFELSDTMAEELISLAIAMALENVESTRLQTKLSTLSLEG